MEDSRLRDVGAAGGLGLRGSGVAARALDREIDVAVIASVARASAVIALLDPFVPIVGLSSIYLLAQHVGRSPSPVAEPVVRRNSSLRPGGGVNRGSVPRRQRARRRQIVGGTGSGSGPGGIGSGRGGSGGPGSGLGSGGPGNGGPGPGPGGCGASPRDRTGEGIDPALPGRGRGEPGRRRPPGYALGENRRARRLGGVVTQRPAKHAGGISVSGLVMRDAGDLTARGLDSLTPGLDRFRH